MNTVSVAGQIWFATTLFAGIGGWIAASLGTTNKRLQKIEDLLESINEQAIEFGTCNPEPEPEDVQVADLRRPYNERLADALRRSLREGGSRPPSPSDVDPDDPMGEGMYKGY